MSGIDNLRDLGFIELLDTQGRPVFFQELWEGQLSVLTLTRHFGCMFCFEQIQALLTRRSELEAAGARLLVVGNGNPQHAQQFMRRFGLAEGVYTDPARRLYRRLELSHGLRTSVNWQSTKHARRALQAGYRNEGIKGDRWQQGGTFVSAPDGSLLMNHRSQVAGDQVEVEQVIQALSRYQASAKSRTTTKD